MKRRLIVLFDGTWNTREDRANVNLVPYAAAKDLDPPPFLRLTLTLAPVMILR